MGTPFFFQTEQFSVQFSNYMSGKQNNKHICNWIKIHISHAIITSGSLEWPFDPVFFWHTILTPTYLSDAVCFVCCPKKKKTASWVKMQASEIIMYLYIVFCLLRYTSLRELKIYSTLCPICYIIFGREIHLPNQISEFSCYAGIRNLNTIFGPNAEFLFAEFQIDLAGTESCVYICKNMLDQWDCLFPVHFLQF